MGGPLTLEELLDAKNHNNIKYFVETGTYKADTTIMASKYFDKVYTTEIHPGLYTSAMNRANTENVSNINFYLGDSSTLLRQITPQVLDGAIFFLDAHISGSDSGWNGTDRVPILKELDAILTYKIGPSVFIVDDLRLWKQQVWDWAHITNEGLVSEFTKRNIEVVKSFEKNDRFYIFTN